MPHNLVVAIAVEKNLSIEKKERRATFQIRELSTPRTRIYERDPARIYEASYRIPGGSAWALGR